MFTEDEKEQFALRGLIKRKNFLPVEKLAGARNAVLGQLQREGIWRDGHWHLAGVARDPSPDAGKGMVKPLKRHDSLLALVTDEAEAAASELVAGQPVFPMSPHPALLFTLPNYDSWSVPYKAWHLDMPRLAPMSCPGVQIFAFINTVESGGGGTVAVAGSHRLLNDGVRMSSAAFRKRLKREPYFAELMSATPDDRTRFVRRPSRVLDVEQQVVEMTGQAGDAYFMDLRLLHTIAPNARKVPRIMLTQRFLLEWSRVALYGEAPG